MVKMHLLSTEIWRCDTPAEARALWKSHPADRHRLWSEDEVAHYMLCGPEEIAAAIAAKVAKPGKLPDVPQMKT